MATSVSQFECANTSESLPDIYKIKVVIGNSPNVLTTYDESTDHYWMYKSPGSLHLTELFHISANENVLQINAYYDSQQTSKIKWFLTLRERRGEMEPFPRFRSLDDIASGRIVVDHKDFTVNQSDSGSLQSLSVKSSDGKSTYYLVPAADPKHPMRVGTSDKEVFSFDISEKYYDTFLLELDIGWEVVTKIRFQIDGF